MIGYSHVEAVKAANNNAVNNANHFDNIDNGVSSAHRPPDIVRNKTIMSMLLDGVAVTEIARRLKVSRGTVYRCKDLLPDIKKVSQ